MYNEFEQQNINCGGYALNIDTCIFGDGRYTFDEAVWGLLKRFDFIRLIDKNEKINEDEYKVYYRNNETGGHHFVKEEDGEKTDKWGPEKVKPFNGWNNLESAKEVVFAVKKEHERYKRSIFISDLIPENFERVVKQFIYYPKELQTFRFNNKEYQIKMADSKSDDIFVVTEKDTGDKVADVLKYEHGPSFMREIDMVMEVVKGKGDSLITESERDFKQWVNNRQSSLDEIIEKYSAQKNEVVNKKLQAEER